MARPGTRILAVLVLSLAGCPKRVVVVNGQELSEAQATDTAREELAQVRAGNRGLAPEAAADRLLAFADRYRGVMVAAEAQHEAAELLLSAGKAERAGQVAGTLLTEYPLYPRALEAKYTLALADLKRGRVRDGLQTLASVYPRLPEERKRAAAAQAAAGAEAVGAMPEAIRWLSEVAARASGAERDAALARAVEAVDRLAFPEVDRVRESLPPDSPLQPALVLKQARIQVHLRDYQRAEVSAREVFQRWPDSPYAKDAQAILDRISKLTFVRPNVIGVAVPLSGTFKRWGEAILQGIGLALEGAPGVKLVVRDTRGDPDGAAQAITQLTLEEGAIVVVGGVTNAEAEKAAAVAEELQVPLVSLSKQEGVTDVGPNVFQNMLTPSAQARALVELFMGRRGMKRFAIMYPQIPYGVELANAFWDEVEARGGEIRGVESYAADRTTFTPLVKEMVGKLYLEERSDFGAAVRDLGPAADAFRRRKAWEKVRDNLPPITDFDAIFIPDFPKNLRLITPALAVEDVVTQTCLPDEVARIRRTTGRKDLQPVQLLGANGWGADPTLFDTSPGAPGRYLRCAVFVDGFYAGSERAATRAFVEAFQKKYQGQVPTILEASAFDAARMVRELITVRKVQTRADFRDGLAAVTGFKGATGDITMGKKRTPEKELFFLTVDQDGVRELTREELSAAGVGGG